MVHQATPVKHSQLESLWRMQTHGTKPVTSKLSDRTHVCAWTWQQGFNVNVTNVSDLSSLIRTTDIFTGGREFSGCHFQLQYKMNIQQRTTVLVFCLAIKWSFYIYRTQVQFLSQLPCHTFVVCINRKNGFCTSLKSRISVDH